MHMAFRTLWHYLFVGRRGPKLGFYDVSRSQFRVWPTDIDLLLHMNNGKYLSVMDIARYDMIQRNGILQTFQREGWYTVVVGQTISYRKSLKPGQKYCIESRILGMDEKAVYVEQRFVRLGPDKEPEVYCKAFVRARVLRKTGGTVPMDEVLHAVGAEREEAPELSPKLLEWRQLTTMPSTRSPAPSTWT